METKFGNGHQRTDGYIQITSGPYKGQVPDWIIKELETAQILECDYEED